MQILGVSGSLRKASLNTAALKACAGLMPTGMSMTVAQIGESASSWSESELQAALDYERENANRKTAVSALESAIEKSEEAE